MELSTTQLIYVHSPHTHTQNTCDMRFIKFHYGSRKNSRKKRYLVSY